MINFTQMLENYGLPAQYVDEKKYRRFIKNTLDNVDDKNDKITALFASLLLSYILGKNNDEKILYAKVIQNKFDEFSSELNVPTIQLSNMYSRPMFYFDKTQLSYINQFNPVIGDCLAAISTIDNDTGIILYKNTRCRDLTNLIIKYMMMIRNNMMF